jgi:hypothetical protein
MGNDAIHLPQEIKDALLEGYEVHIKAAKKENGGGLYAKITFHRVKVAGKEMLESKKP